MGSGPSWSYGYVPTAAEWISWFVAKMDDPGFSPSMISAMTAGVNVAGGLPTLDSSALIDVIQGGTGAGTTQAACANLGAQYTLAASGAAASHTGDTTETTLATVTLPANSLGSNGFVIVESIWTMPNNGNNKTTRVKFGATTVMSAVFTTEVSFTNRVKVQNRNATNSQVANPTIVGSGGWGQSTTAVTTGAIDTTASVTILLTGQLGTNTDTITLESYSVNVVKI